MTFGVLGASCDPARAAAEHQAGVRVAVLQVAWDRFEPAPGAFEPGYIAELNGRAQACRAAGLKIVLGIGLNFAPEWVRALPGATYVGRSGQPPANREIDLVYSGAVRRAVSAYLTRLASDVGFAEVVGIRVGTNASGEFGYPGPDPADEERRFWALGPAPQDGTDLADGMSVSPLPGWIPGEPLWRGRPVTPADISAWYDWYSRSLVDAVGWQMEQLRTLGFTGRFHVPVAGRGVQPDGLRVALTARLASRVDRDGAVGRGLNYTVQFPLIAAIDERLHAASPSQGVDIGYTGIDDDTAVQARALNPPQDACRPDDTNGLLTRTGTGVWSAQRWTIALARSAGLRVVGENPGVPGQRTIGGASFSEPVGEQLRRAVGYAEQCRLTAFYWAFEDQLFTPESGVDLGGYGRWISTAPRAR